MWKAMAQGPYAHIQTEQPVLVNIILLFFMDFLLLLFLHPTWNTLDASEK